MTDDEQLIVRAIGRHAPGANVVLVGSRATGTASADSDYDIVVGVPRRRLPRAVRSFGRASVELAEDLGVPVTISPVPEPLLHRPPRNLFLWKLQREGRVLAGDLRLTDPGPLRLTPASRRSYALTAILYLLEQGPRAAEKAEEHRRFLGGGDLVAEASLPAPRGLGTNVRYVVLSALRGRNRVRTLLSRGSVEARLAAVAVGLLGEPTDAELEQLRRLLPRSLAPAPPVAWEGLRDVVLAEWPAAHPVMAQ